MEVVKWQLELWVVQFWSEIILVISNPTCAARSFHFEFRPNCTLLSSITIINILNKIMKRKEENATVTLLWTLNSVMASKLLTCFIRAAVSTTATKKNKRKIALSFTNKHQF